MVLRSKPRRAFGMRGASTLRWACVALIALNETLIAHGSLELWIGVATFQALLAHIFFWLVILLTYPFEDDKPAL